MRVQTPLLHSHEKEGEGEDGDGGGDFRTIGLLGMQCGCKGLGDGVCRCLL